MKEIDQTPYHTASLYVYIQLKFITLGKTDIQNRHEREHWAQNIKKLEIPTHGIDLNAFYTFSQDKKKIQSLHKLSAF